MPHAGVWPRHSERALVLCLAEYAPSCGQEEKAGHNVRLLAMWIGFK
jgi:hypothetical protein